MDDGDTSFKDQGHDWHDGYDMIYCWGFLFCSDSRYVSQPFNETKRKVKWEMIAKCYYTWHVYFLQCCTSTRFVPEWCTSLVCCRRTSLCCPPTQQQSHVKSQQGMPRSGAGAGEGGNTACPWCLFKILMHLWNVVQYCYLALRKVKDVFLRVISIKSCNFV